MLETINQKLNDLLSTLDLEGYSNPHLNILLIPNWMKDNIGKEYYRIFKEVFKLAENDYIFQNQGGSAHLTSIAQLADYSIALGIKNGAENALKQIDNYLKSDEIIAYEVILLPSAHIQKEFEFDNKVKLIFPKSIPNKFVANELQSAHPYGYAPIPVIHSVLLYEGKQSKFMANKGTKHNFDNERISLNPLFDTLRCLSLSRPPESGIQPYAKSLISDEELPFWKSDDKWQILPYKKPPNFHSIISLNELEFANELLYLYGKLPEKLKTKLIISMDKLNDFGSGLEIVDRAINLRTCLESIFLNDGNKEQLRFTLSLRASLFLGKSYEARKEIFDIMKKTYDVTSTAVHEGIFKEENRNVLIKASELAREAIIKLIKSGKKQDWNEIELGKNSNEKH